MRMILGLLVALIGLGVLLLEGGTDGGVLFADPPPSPTVRVFCLRITDIRLDPTDAEGDRFQFEIEILNWTNETADGLLIALTNPNAGGVTIAAAGIDSNGRPLVVEDVNGDTTTIDPAALSDLEDIDGDGILDANEDNGMLDSGFFDNANGRLDNDPIPGNLAFGNDWSVATQTATQVRWQGGSAIPNRDVLGAADPRKLVEGWNQGAGPTSIDGTGNVTPLEAIDNGNNVLDGFTFTVDNVDVGDSFQLNWFLENAGNSIGSNAFGFGVLNLSRVNGSLPGPVFVGNTGVTQERRDFFDSVYVVGSAEFAVEFGPSLTAQFVEPDDNIFSADVNATPVPPGDSDLDGCLDVAENGTNPQIGGLRNPNSFWDFFDTWNPDGGGGWEKDKVINIPDILGVGARFGPGPGPVSKGQAMADALATPAAALGYHAAFDRGEVIGANNWDRAQADGTINIIDDILGVAFQFGHDCS